MASVTFTCDISGPLDADLRLEVFCDGESVAVFDPVHSHEFTHVFEDSIESVNHSICFVMKNKLPEHTLLDESGNIISDRLLTIHNKRFENIDVDYAFNSRAVYTHDFNGTADTIDDTFCGIMGCNGQVKFEFSTPIYLWMLENL